MYSSSLNSPYWLTTVKILTLNKHYSRFYMKKYHCETFTSSSSLLQQQNLWSSQCFFSGRSNQHVDKLWSVIGLMWYFTRSTHTLRMHQACRWTNWWQKPQQEVAVRPHRLLSPASCCSVEQVLFGSRSFPLLLKLKLASFPFREEDF